MPNDFDLLGLRQAARARELARALDERVGPAHPDFSAAEPSTPAVVPDQSDAAIEFARVGPLVDRMRAAFFAGGS